MEKENKLEVNGFRFSSQQMADQAAMELRKIQYLETKIDYGDTRKVQAIYEKAVRENVFQTAVGLFYLKGIRDYLVREDERYEAVLPAVPALMTEGEKGETGRTEDGKLSGGHGTEWNSTAKTRTAEAKREERRKKELQEKQHQLRLSLIVNAVLVLGLIAMFFIALRSEQPNILNYEKNIKDRYAAWEQELTEREQAVRKMELELIRKQGE